MSALSGKALGYETEGRILKNVRKDSEPLVDLLYTFTLWLFCTSIPLVTWILEYSAVLILFAFSISCGGEFYQSRFMHSILQTQCGEEFYKYRVFGPAVTIMRRIFQAEKIFTSYSGRLPYPGRLFYYYILVLVLFAFTTLCRGENHLATHAL